ncbi:protein uxt [Anaeramoeba flamelloides]|uniref:Protein uxt n=1 Tax=Anaeramoeba flamelloides TaxID=1746091 RepID=A0AAV7Z607_9EUKA|nr:protein uxt [Anaeramoeba flamelloides]KAJ6233605.1 protein uxt [Anaeramoeba flamelloides]
MDVYTQRRQKIVQYEQFINEKLKPDLKKVLDARDKIYERISKYLVLQNNIKLVQENKINHMSTLINLASNFYVQSKVNDTSKIILCVGLDVYLEFTLEDAIEWITKKTETLTKEAEEYTQKSLDIKADLRIVSEGIFELMRLIQNKRNKNY